MSCVRVTNCKETLCRLTVLLINWLTVDSWLFKKVIVTGQTWAWSTAEAWNQQQYSPTQHFWHPFVSGILFDTANFLWSDKANLVTHTPSLASCWISSGLYFLWGDFPTWGSSCQAACVWEWLLVTSVTAGPVRTDRLDCGSTTERLFLRGNKRKRRVHIMTTPESTETVPSRRQVVAHQIWKEDSCSWHIARYTAEERAAHRHRGERYTITQRA